MAEKEYIERNELIEAWERETKDATDLFDAFDWLWKVSLQPMWWRCGMGSGFQAVTGAASLCVRCAKAETKSINRFIKTHGNTARTAARRWTEKGGKNDQIFQIIMATAQTESVLQIKWL